MTEEKTTKCKFYHFHLNGKPAKQIVPSSLLNTYVFMEAKRVGYAFFNVADWSMSTHKMSWYHQKNE